MGMASDEASQLPGLPGYNKDNLQPWTVAVVTSVTVLAVVTIGLRLLSRRIKHQQLWWDDKMILFSMVCSPIEVLQGQPSFLIDLDKPLIAGRLAGLELGRCRIHICNVFVRHGASCRPSASREHCHDG